MTERDKVTVEDITGIVHTDEPTDSVEEVRKLRGRTNERFIVDDAGTLIDMETRNTYDYVSEVLPLLNGLTNEIKIAQSVIQMKRDQISSLARSNREGVKKVQSLAKEKENLKDEVYEEIDNALTVLMELYEDIPLKSQSKMNNLYNRLESLREEMK